MLTVAERFDKLQDELDSMLIDILGISRNLSLFYAYVPRSVLLLECDAETIVVSAAGLEIPEGVWQKMHPPQNPYDYVAAHVGDRYFFEWLRKSGQKARVLVGNREHIKSSQWSDVLLLPRLQEEESKVLAEV